MSIFRVLVMAVCASVAAPGLLAAAERLHGSVWGDVVHVVDGDTVEVDARIWPGQTVRTLVRVVGIDTPELRGECDTERRLAQKAKEFVTRELATGQVELRQVGIDKFGGRVLAQVMTEDGRSVAESLIAAGLARRYDGGKRQSWCAG